MKQASNRDIEAAVAAISGLPISHIFLVGCGGSLAIMHPAKYFLDRYSRALSSDVYNADEFVCRDPKRLGGSAVVILCSQTGNTTETVRAARHAKTRGAHCIGMTLDPASQLAAEVDSVIRFQSPYTTGIAIDAADSNYAVLYKLLTGLVRQTDGTDLMPVLLSSLERLQSVIDEAVISFGKKFDAFAPRFKDRSTIYTLAAGPNYGAAYSFSICVLMEMQWYNGQAIHANEFFHGPFEIVDENACFIAMVGLDETRALAERAVDFLRRFGSPENILVLDAKELDLSGIDERFRGYLVPLVFFDALWKFAYQLAELRHHPMLEGRRYMKKITGY